MCYLPYWWEELFTWMWLCCWFIGNSRNGTWGDEIWTQKSFLRRPLYSQYENFMHELMSDDPASFHNLIRMFGCGQLLGDGEQAYSQDHTPGHFWILSCALPLNSGIQIAVVRLSGCPQQYIPYYTQHPQSYLLGVEVRGYVVSPYSHTVESEQFDIYVHMIQCYSVWDMKKWEQFSTHTAHSALGASRHVKS